MTFDDIRIIRSKRRTIALEVRADGSVMMRAPQEAPERILRGFFEERKAWVEKHQSAQKEQHLKTQRFFQPGEIFHYLGQGYPLQLRNSGKRFELVEQFWLHEASLHRAQKLFENWYKKRARQIFTERLDHYAQQMNLSYDRLRLSSATTRWGSCRGARINLTWRLVMAPIEVIDSVVIHELAHIRHKNHGPHFWQLVYTHCPDYKTQDKWLKHQAHLLAW